MQLNCILIVLNVAELSQALAEFYAGFYSIWTVYILGNFILTDLSKCTRILVALNVAELS